MILVDTSIWIDHLRSKDVELEHLLHTGDVICHPFIIGEIALGSIRQRDPILQGLGRLPMASIAHASEVLHLISQRGLFGRGIGYVDAHLLAAVQITPDTALWTRDKRLHQVALTLGVAWPEAQAH